MYGIRVFIAFSSGLFVFVCTIWNGMSTYKWNEKNKKILQLLKLYTINSKLIIKKAHTSE